MEKLARDNLGNCLLPLRIDTENDLFTSYMVTRNGAIVDFIKRDDFDLIVMGTLARTGISGILIGNAPEKIINGIKCSPLAIKPNGFVSPITA